MMRTLLKLIAFVFFGLLVSNTALASENVGQEEVIEGVVISIPTQDELYFPDLDVRQPHQILEILVTKGSNSGSTISVENGDVPTSNITKYEVGDRLVIVKNNVGNEDVFYITDYVRRSGLLTLFLIFVGIALLIGRWHGFTSLLGMGLSLLIIISFILPQIAKGNDPVTVAIIGALVMVPITFYLSHGFNQKTHVAVGSTIISLVVTGLLANFFVSLTKLTGYGSEEAGFLQAYHQGAINIRGLLLAGIIIGGLGVFDDITISQASIVLELKKASSKLSFYELYRRAMNVGHDHIASLINTLVLVYTGAALPLLLLFLDTSKSFAEIINYEFMADEIVRTLVASIGLILAVPITTAIAAAIFTQKFSKTATKNPA